MTITGTLRQLLVALQGPAVEIAYGVNAGNTIRHGEPAPPPPRTSRDVAVAAYFKGRAARWQVVYEHAITSADEPRGRLLAVFDALQTAAVEPRLRNITFADTHLAQGPEARRVVDRHFRLLRQRLLELAQATGAHDSQDLADAIERLSVGAAAMTADTDALQAIVIAREVARERLEAATAQLPNEDIRRKPGSRG
jgi:hypothetical protein